MRSISAAFLSAVREKKGTKSPRGRECGSLQESKPKVIPAIKKGKPLAAEQEDGEHTRRLGAAARVGGPMAYTR